MTRVEVVWIDHSYASDRRAAKLYTRRTVGWLVSESKKTVRVALNADELGIEHIMTLSKAMVKAIHPLKRSRKDD